MAAVYGVLPDPTNELPYEVSLVIFSFVPAQDLVKNCVLVCRFWKAISDDQTTWRLKCLRTGRFQPKYMKSFEPDDWKSYYYKNPYSRSLLKNPNLADAFPRIRETKTQQLSSWHGYGELNSDQWNAQFYPWEMVHIGGNGLCLECPPIGCYKLPGDNESCCIATSFQGTTRCQVVDLVAEGVSEYILDECKLPIQVYEWFNGRYDCGVEYYLKVCLKDKKRDKIPGFKVKLTGQKTAGYHEWDKLEHVFHNYPQGVRYVQFKDFGKDTAFWDGYYGAKLSGATVKFLLD